MEFLQKLIKINLKLDIQVIFHPLEMNILKIVLRIHPDESTYTLNEFMKKIFS